MSKELKSLREETKAMKQEVETMEEQLTAHLASLGVTQQLNVDEERITREIYNVGDDQLEEGPAQTQPPKMPRKEEINALSKQPAKEAVKKQIIKSVAPSSPAPPELNKKPSQKLSAPGSRESSREENGSEALGSLSISGISLANSKK